jgi:amino acid adenylation domain-containing protein
MDHASTAGTPDHATATREAAIAALRSHGFRCEQPGLEGLHDAAPDSLRLASLALALAEGTGRHVPLRLLFDARTVGDLIDALERAGGDEAEPASHCQPLDPAGRRDRSLLTFSQERMVFMQGLAERSAAYSVVFGLRLAGGIDVPRMEQALAMLVERRPALRARFLPSGEGTAMVPSDSFRFRLDRIEPAAPTLAEAVAGASVYAREPFDLETGPAFRAAHLGAGAGESLLVLVFHHVVIDQFAFEGLLAELAALYDDPTPRPVVTERRKHGAARDSYAQWQRNWFRQHGFERQRAYWIPRMAGVERITLPPDHARPAFPDFVGARRPLRLDEATWTALERLAAERQASLAMLLQSALWLLLRNHTGTADITTGLAIANRNHRGAANVGLSLVNTIPLRVDGGGATRFSEVLARVRTAFLEGFENQDLPFDLLVKQLDLDRRAGLSPLFGVMLNMLNVPTTPRTFGEVGIERVEIDRGGAQFDLTLTVDRQFTRTIWFDYAVALYEPETVQRFASRLEVLLAALVAGGLDQDCNRLPHRTPDEAALLRTGSGSSLPLTSAPDPWRLFTDAARRNPERIAATDAMTRWRYADLERAAASIAAGLGAAGLLPGDRIGVLVDRGVALPAVLWGALAARITFVPLDATLPADRLRHIVTDSGMNAVVAQGSGDADAGWLPASVRRLVLDELLSCEPLPIPERPPHGIAYVLYTSGTTGRPKGVAIPQAALGQFLQAMQRWPGIAPDERVLAVTTLTFDISLLELLLPTSSGASVHIAARDEVRDGALLATLIREQDISLLQGTPATWYQLKSAGWGGDPRLRAFVGGEAFPPGLAAWLQPRVAELWNLYGPTEATVWITCHRVTDAAAAVVPVGRPIDGATVHVVDVYGREAPLGVEGEIVLGGAGLAEGYVNLPELTAERFRAFPAIDGCDRAYRTGDRGRWNPDGLLEVLGRLDSQLKLRGYRIEAAEIETLALEVPGVSKALASVRSGAEGDDRLVLHVEAAADDGLPALVLDRLRRGLPDYMLPQQIVQVGAFPLQPNGKVDRIALAQPGPRQSGADPLTPAMRREPQDATEAALLGLWRELLAETSVGVDDDFFRCGGHSLLAMRLVGRIRQDLRLPCTLAEVFRHPTPRALTAVLRSARPLDAETIVPLRMTGEAPPLFCICGVQLYRRLADALEDAVQVFGAFIPMDADAAESGGAGVVRVLATRYVEMIRRYQPRGPYRLLGFSLGGVVAYEMAQQLVAANESVESLVLLDSDAPGPERRQWARKAWANVRRRYAAGRTPDAVTPHIRAIRRYAARPYSGPVLYVEARRAERADAVTDWDQLVPQHHREVVDCDHLELMEEPQASQVAQAIRAHLRLD